MATPMRKVTAVQWSWRGDAAWTPYDAKTNLHVETEFLEGVKRITIDGERFVDVSLKPKVIQVKWYCPDCEDKNCIGLQRRIDDESKRRAVRREAAPFLKSFNVALLFSEDDQAFVEAMVTTHKGTVKNEVTRRTKMVVLGNGMTVADFQEQIDNAINLSIPVVHEQWLAECIKAQTILDDQIANWLVAGTVVAPAAAATAPTKSTKGDETIEDDEGASVGPPPAKRAKTSEIDDSPSTASSSSGAAIPIPIADSDKMDIVPTSTSAKTASNDAVPSSSTSIVAPATYLGVLIAKEQTLAFIMNIESIHGSNVDGNVVWPSLNHACTKLSGQLSSTSFNFEEVSIIVGDEDVEAGTKYNGTIEDSGKKISGTWNLDPESGQFEAYHLSSSSASKMAIPSASSTLAFDAGSTYQGNLYTSQPFKLKVLTRTGNQLSGNLEFEGFTSSFTGEIKANQLNITEDRIISSVGHPHSVPAVYNGFFTNLDFSSIKGSVSREAGSTFSLSLPK